MPSLETAKSAWASNYAGLSQPEIDLRVRGFTTLVRAIAADGVVSPERFAELMELPASRAAELFAGLAAFGMQSDEKGNIIGAALTTRETAHRIRLGGAQLFAWCALDTLFIPGLVGETAEIESKCPSSGEGIRLTVSPDRVEACEPAATWLSVFLPGGSGAAGRVGPASPT